MGKCSWLRWTLRGETTVDAMDADVAGLLTAEPDHTFDGSALSPVEAGRVPRTAE